MADIVKAVDQAITKLAETLNSFYVRLQDIHIDKNEPRGTPRRYLFPTDTYAAGVWRPGEDIHIVCMTEGGHHARFWEAVSEQIFDKKWNGYGAALDTGSAEIPWATLQVPANKRPKGTKFFLYHCSMPPKFDLKSMFQEDFWDDYRPFKSAAARHVARVRNAAEIVATLDNVEDFEIDYLREAYNRIRTWADAMGIMGEPLGLVNSIRLFQLVMGAECGYVMFVQDNWAGSEEGSFLQAFFLRGEILMGAYLAGEDGVAEGWTVQGVRALLRGISLVRRTCFDKPRRCDVTVKDMTRRHGFRAFLDGSKCFLLITAENWSSTGGQATYFDSILPKLIRKLIELECPPKYAARVWPYPSQEGGCHMYVIGMTGEKQVADEDMKSFTNLSLASSRDVPDSKVIVSRQNMKAIEQLFGAPTRESHVAAIKTEAESRKATVAQPSTEAPQGQDAAAVAATESRKPAGQPPTEAPQSQNAAAAAATESRKAAAQSPSEAPHSENAAAPAATESRRPAAQPPTEAPQTQQATFDRRDTLQTPPPPRKLRPADSAISRLRHDPAHTGTTYQVGYTDRFLAELQWVSLDQWGGKATEDEDFIPQTRVKQIRRVEDEIVVWDREARIDRTGETPASVAEDAGGDGW